MNPASRIWDIPPPPGTEDLYEEPSSSLNVESEKDVENEKKRPKETSVKDEKAPERNIDRINPYLKNPEYIEYEKRRLERRHRTRSRSRSRDRYHRRRYSRSRSRDHYRRTRSRSRRRRRKYSSSRSKSRSPSYHRRHKYNKRRYSRSRSRSKSTSRSRHGSRRPKNYKDKKSRSRSPLSKPLYSQEKPVPDLDTSEVDMKIEEEEEDPTKDNVFKNDGTFLEMFKKMQEQQQKIKEEPIVPESKKILPIFGKRRGGKVLKTGLVQKVRQQNEEENSSQDAWSVYMKEVRKYKEACCDDDSKTRPLVK